MARHRVALSILVGAMTLAASMPAALAATPKCFGETATLVGSNKSETLRGTAGPDVIVGQGGSDTILGRGGNDMICAGGGGDVVKGGGGDDYVLGQGGNDTIRLGAGADLVHGGAGTDNITGADGDDYFFPDDGNDSYIGGPGFDQLDANLVGGPMNVNLASGIVSGAGTDQVDHFELVYGSQYNDTMTGSDELDIFLGLQGDDTIDGGANLDLILGGGQPDVTETGNDLLDGGADFDIVLYWYSTGPVDADLAAGMGTGEGTDELNGFESVAGSEFDDVLRGDHQANYLFGEGGNDQMDGRAGFDVVAYWFAEQAIQANMGTDTATGEGNDAFSNVEGVAGTISFGDTLTGGDENDYLDGDGGNDTLLGGAGDDWFVGGLGDDTIDGGAGTYDLAQALNFAPVTVNLALGTATGDGSDDLTAVEAFSATDFADVLTGDELANVLFGWAGNDTITGAGGDDDISAGDGIDTVDAGAGTDDCVGAESPLSCETANDPVIHPVAEGAAEAGAVREFSRRLKF